MRVSTRQEHDLLQGMVRVIVCLMAYLAGGGLMQPGMVSIAATAQTMAALKRQMHDGPACEDTFAFVEAPLPDTRRLFVVHTGTEVQMAQDFALFLQHNGFDADIHDELFIVVRYNDEYFLMDLRAGKGE